MSAAENYQPLEEPPSAAKRCCKGCAKISAGLCGILVVLLAILQGVLYWWATMKCNPRSLKDYEYPGGGHDDLVPPDSLLVEQEPRWWGNSFINIPANKAGLANGASTGVYFRTWGPLWYTYTYQDILGQQTFVVRDRPLAFGGSHKIMRCDGTGPSYVVGEGGHLIMNMIREIFGMYTSRVYNIWEGNTLVAVSEKLGGGGQSHKQLIFRDPAKATPFATAFLAHRNYHGVYDQWFVESTPNTTLPNFVPNAATMLMAFPTAEAKLRSQAHKGMNKASPNNDVPENFEAWTDEALSRLDAVMEPHATSAVKPELLVAPNELAMTNSTAEVASAPQASIASAEQQRLRGTQGQEPSEPLAV